MGEPLELLEIDQEATRSLGSVMICLLYCALSPEFKYGCYSGMTPLDYSGFHFWFAILGTISHLIFGPCVAKWLRLLSVLSATAVRVS